MPETIEDIFNKSNLTLDQSINLIIGKEIIQAIQSLRQFTGDLNTFRVSPSDLRNLAIQMIAADVEDIGLEDLLHSIRTIAKKTSS